MNLHKFEDYDIRFRTHAIQRMFERSITQSEVYEVLKNGTAIDKYPDDEPYPSKLLLEWVENRPLHVVVAENSEDQFLIVVTVYEPDPDKWNPEFDRRNPS